MKHQKNKYEIYLKEGLQLVSEGKSYTAIAEILHKKHKPPMKLDTFRVALGKYIKRNETEVIEKAQKPELKKDDRRPFVLSAWNIKKGLMMDVDEYCNFYKLPRKDIASYKLVSHTGTPFYNILFKENIELAKDLTEEFIAAAIQKHIHPVLVPKFKGEPSVNCLRVIYTDTHIAMETNENGFSLFGGVWNEKELFARKAEVISEIMQAHQLFGDFDEIHVMDFGDFMDGWNAETVRGGHELPQNMDNEKAFDVGLSFKVDLIKEIIALNITPAIKSFNICNDNHSGSFGYVVNSAAKRILEGLYPALVKVENLRKFINHYHYGKHCFIMSHGKDAKAKKFGFRPILDAKAKEAIDGYITNNKLFHTAEFITFEKGDSHQQLFDYTTSDDFDYMNYMAFSPSSEWIQTNFKRGRSGFNLMVVNKNINKKIMIPTEFVWVNASA